MTGFAITGWGVAAPEQVVTNRDLEATLDTSDEWIRERSGIGARRWVRAETTAELAAEAAVAACKQAGRTPAELGMVVLATSSPDQAMPPTAAAVCDLIGATCGSFDLNGACTGYGHALLVGAGLVGGAPGPVLVVGAERMSALVDKADRTTAVLFGDGAGALVLEAVAGDPSVPGGGVPGLVAWDAGTDGSLKRILEIPAGEAHIRMVGGEVFKKAVRVVVDSCGAVLAAAGASGADVGAFVPHQANARIVEAARARLGIPVERTVLGVEEWGNTSAASIPVALAGAVEGGRVAPGDLVLVSGFGAGMTWASALLRWSPTTTGERLRGSGTAGPDPA